MGVTIPYVGPIDGGFNPGKMVRVHGSPHSSANRFAVNVQSGPNLHPRDDIVMHVSAIFAENVLSRASLQQGMWGPEERTGTLPIGRGQPFEMILLCDAQCFKIAINGQHFCEFIHRVPYHTATHLVIEGDIDVSHISWEGGASNPGGFSSAPTGMYPPLAGGGAAVPYPTNSSAMPPYSGAGGYVPPPPPGSAPYVPPSPYGQPQAGYGAPGGYNPGYNPSSAPGYNPGYGQPAGYGPQPPYGQPPHGQIPYGQPGYNPQAGYGQPGYPPPPPGYSDQQYQKSDDGFGGFLGKAGAALAGALGSAGVLGAITGNKPGQGTHNSSGGGGMLGKVGAALGIGAGAAALGSVLGGKSHHHTPGIGGIPGLGGGHGGGGGGMLGKVGTALGLGAGAAALGGGAAYGGKKAHKKAKKAAKYGIPIAGLGLGAYALHKGVKGFHGSSSSSSSSSEEE